MKFPRQKPITLVVQDLNIRRAFPNFILQRKPGASTAVWRGKLQPQPTSSQYLVEVRYNISSPPEVRVLNPPLVKNPPHVYAENKLCLYWPKETPWTGRNLISATIIPWTAMWLFYYELWLDTGRWLGPEAPHTPGAVKKPR